MTKALVIGLDCAAPRFVFDEYAGVMPNISELITGARSGILLSCDPPITVPAWAVMASGRDPGEIGMYGFRNRRSDYSYRLTVASSEYVRGHDPIWESVGAAGGRSVILSVPPAYPPGPIDGTRFGCFLTPDSAADVAYPAEAGRRIEARHGRYILDAKPFRTEEKDLLLEKVRKMNEQRFAVARTLMKEEDWDLFWMVEMGTDRLHHAFWKFADPGHPGHVPGSRYEDVLRDHYARTDEEIGRLLAEVPDDTAVLVVSDHGAAALEGCIAINEFLIREGYLVLKDTPERPARLDEVEVDWSRTRAWGEGGYYGRLFLNIRGREPEGIVDPDEADGLLGEIATAFEELGDRDGNPIGTRCHRPADLYRAVTRTPPDLFIYFGDLKMRSVGKVGTGSVHHDENDTGPDDANHAREAVYVLKAPGVEPGSGITASIMDIAPALRRILGVEVPEDQTGRGVDLSADGAFGTEEEKELASHLEDLGYI